MTSTNRSIHLVMVTISLLSVLSLVVVTNHAAVNAQGSEQKFTAKLTAKEEVPPNNSPATGMAWIKPSEREVGFEVNVTDIYKANSAQRLS